MSRPPTADDFLRLSPRIRVLPVVHGSGDFAVRVRDELLSRTPDCLAVPLPPSLQEHVEDAVRQLPVVSAVVQRDADGDGYSYVPIDPCQAVVAAVRLALGEHIPSAFIDLETPRFEPQEGVFPDPYALKKVSPAGFAAAVLPSIPPPQGQQADRVRWMAQELRKLERRYNDVVLVCSLLDWPWVRQAYKEGLDAEEPEPFFAPVATFTVAPRTLAFFLGELPFVTGLYERGRIELGDDGNLSVDGVKEMVLAARDRLRRQDAHAARRITPHLLDVYFRYVRNLCLIDRRLTPDLYTLVLAAKQTAGNAFALTLAEVSREYPFPPPDDGEPRLRMSVGRADVPLWGEGSMVNRLPGQAINWRALDLETAPSRRDRRRWDEQFRWNPYGACTWPAEDDWRDAFNSHVREQALAVLGADLARSEKFTTSVMDGIDVRETLRNWHTGDVYVKIIPPRRGSVEVVVFLFDVPADPRRYPHRATWGAEHGKQSWLTFFATDHRANVVGPGVALSEYGGMMLLFPPRDYPCIWTDARLDFADTLEERLLAGAMLHSRERHVVVVCHGGVRASWRRLERRLGKKLLHLPASRFSASTLERLRHFHVLNGHHVRSYAAEFIRDFK